VDPGQRPDPWDAAAGTYDHAPVDLLAQDRVRAAYVTAAFGGDGGGLDAEPELAKGLGGFEDGLVAGLPPLLE
jgi:hypothetical protein